MAGAAGARGQPPDVGAHLVEGFREGRATAPLIAALGRLERALVGAEDGVSHGGKLADRPRWRKASPVRPYRRGGRGYTLSNVKVDSTVDEDMRPLLLSGR